MPSPEYKKFFMTDHFLKRYMERIKMSKNVLTKKAKTNLRNEINALLRSSSVVPINDKDNNQYCLYEDILFVSQLKNKKTSLALITCYRVSKSNKYKRLLAKI
jgi:hypothetical protein